MGRRRMGEADTFSALRVSLRLPPAHPLRVTAMEVMTSVLARHDANVNTIASELGVDPRSVRRLVEEYRVARGDDAPADMQMLRTERPVERAHPPVRWCSCAGCKSARAA